VERGGEMGNMKSKAELSSSHYAAATWDDLQGLADRIIEEWWAGEDDAAVVVIRRDGE